MTLVSPPAFADDHFSMLQAGRAAIAKRPEGARAVGGAFDPGNLELGAILVMRHDDGAAPRALRH